MRLWIAFRAFGSKAAPSRNLILHFVQRRSRAECRVFDAKEEFALILFHARVPGFARFSSALCIVVILLFTPDSRRIPLPKAMGGVVHAPFCVTIVINGRGNLGRLDAWIPKLHNLLWVHNINVSVHSFHENELSGLLVFRLARFCSTLIVSQLAKTAETVVSLFFMPILQPYILHIISPFVAVPKKEHLCPPVTVNVHPRVFAPWVHGRPVRRRF